MALLDADIGLRNLDLLLGLENRILYTAIDILEGECRLDQALIRDKRWKNLALLSISRNRQRCGGRRGCARMGEWVGQGGVGVKSRRRCVFARDCSNLWTGCGSRRCVS